MKIPLSYAELNACRHWGSAKHREYLVATHENIRGWHWVALPAAGWRSLADRLIREAFHASGRHRKTRNVKDGVAATRQAAQKIERALATLVMHPAMQAQGQAGVSGDVLFAWRAERGHYSPFPVPGRLPVFLVPSYQEEPGVGTVTVWHPQDTPPIEIPELFGDPLHHKGWD